MGWIRWQSDFLNACTVKVGKPDAADGSWSAESHTRPAWEKQGALIVAINLPTEYSPRQQWRFFSLPTQLGDKDCRINPSDGGGNSQLEQRWCVHGARASHITKESNESCISINRLSVSSRNCRVHHPSSGW